LTITSEDKNSGSYSAQAGSIGDDETTSLEITLDCIAGYISFYRKVSSEKYYDYLRFYIDGTEQDKWSGEKDWEKVSYSVIEVTRTFTWECSKDGSVFRREDTAYIDDIVFPIH
jgi:hypothetical protein